MKRSILPCALFVLPLLLGSCAALTPSEQLQEMYVKTIEPPPQNKKMTRDDVEAMRKNIDRRAVRVRKLVEDEQVGTGEDSFRAAVILSKSERLEDIALAQELALRAYEDGIEPGIEVVAHCMDKQLMMKRRPQLFGTQVVMDPETGKWRLWDLDPSTTDAKRDAFNIPPLHVLQERVEMQNRPR